ncbi:MAG: DUF3237 domain-containing protein [Polyangiales bacterium]
MLLTRSTAGFASLLAWSLSLACSAPKGAGSPETPGIAPAGGGAATAPAAGGSGASPTTSTDAATSNRGTGGSSAALVRDGAVDARSPAADANSATSADAAASMAHALADQQTLVPDPTWDCKLPGGIPPLAGGDMVFEAALQIGTVLDLGQTQYGRRTIAPIVGGTITGPKLNGQVMNGGLDWQVVRPSGALEIEEVAILQTSDGATIYLRNCGIAPDESSAVRIVPDFEAASAGAYAWLNTGTFVGKRELDVVGKTLELTVYDVSHAPAAMGSADELTVPKSDPAMPHQVWDCEPPKGAAGALVYTEAVAIGSGIIAIGQSKYGTRNIIPITGGTFSGQKLNGTVFSGGADFQLTANASTDLQLDARYTLKTDDGELIAVRNCGSASGTKLYFETRSAGPYAWLTTGQFTSSVGLGLGGVAISIYEAH